MLCSTFGASLHHSTGVAPARRHTEPEPYRLSNLDAVSTPGGAWYPAGWNPVPCPFHFPLPFIVSDSQSQLPPALPKGEPALAWVTPLRFGVSPFFLRRGR